MADPLRWDADTSPKPKESRAKRVSAEALIGDHSVIAQARRQRLDRMQVEALAGGHAERDSAAWAIDLDRWIG